MLIMKSGIKETAEREKIPKEESIRMLKEKRKSQVLRNTGNRQKQAKRNEKKR